MSEEAYTWRQPFQWGLLMAFDEAAEWAVPELDRQGGIAATSACLVVPVLHAQDIDIPDGWPDDAPLPEALVQVTVVQGPVAPSSEFECVLACPSGRLRIGDVAASEEIEVPRGPIRVSVTRTGGHHTDVVLLTVAPDS